MQRNMPTLSDVAKRAGVSYATADRVVNARGGVAEKSARRVREAIDALGYVRDVSAANLSQRRTYRFAVVLPAGTNAFFAVMRRALEARREALRRERVELRLEEVAAFDAEALRACLLRLGEAGVDGIALVGSDGPGVAEALE
ncbi:LacI family DNA-binding transcriptional regulator, partial [Salipiger mucosus]|uniref:LacI family DNA-binding transcriptional regulator n=1 Tax=Salipiger mucosus TaxID=263378 RepID=UPI000367AEA8